MKILVKGGEDSQQLRNQYREVRIDNSKVPSTGRTGRQQWRSKYREGRIDTVQILVQGGEDR